MTKGNTKLCKRSTAKLREPVQKDKQSSVHAKASKELLCNWQFPQNPWQCTAAILN